MNFYKRLSRASSQNEIDGIEEEIVDLYGRTPMQVNSLLIIMAIRLIMKELRVSKLDYSKGQLIISFDVSTIVKPEPLIQWVQKKPQSRLAPGDKILYQIGSIESSERANASLSVLRDLISLTNEPELDSANMMAQPGESKVKYKFFKKRAFGTKQ